jgi:hypothetical protein
MTFQEKVKEIQKITKRIADYINSSQGMNEGEIEQCIFFTERLMDNLNGAQILLEAVLGGEKESLEHSKNFLNAAKNTVPQITNRLESIKSEKAMELKNELEKSFNDCWEDFSMEYSKIS